ncbi:ASCH domain-containing protein [Alkalihalophilus lindianensis]|uniref:ASCH domain-containing protein n=1 Tax=Alkalihalophilus lindianensis TaxID=1630542 RepID=A0ABU3X4F3_9BACI|nr:ASCH domain-containing protein [Alkalihalophilus lindianensis]MDV2682763.1 ASCH domain-containing protein [Alkalihalophilus lindianensis]
MKKVQQFWDEFCVEHQKQGSEYKDAFQFGASADELANLVVDGKKTATTSGLVFYELEKEAIPQAGEYYIIFNGQNEPVAVIQIQSVEVLPMNEVSEEFALAEGEGDYQYWWDAHEEFFTTLLKEYEKAFSPNMLVVCERFEKVYPK